MKRSLKLLFAAVALLVASPLYAQLYVPEIPFDSAPDLIKGMPADLYLGEAVGVATNSKGHIFIFTRSGSTNVTTGTNRAFVRSSSRLFEYDQTGKYVREIGHGLYGFVFAHAVRVDPQDNIWVIDEGSSMVMKFNPEGQVIMTMGRKPEAINIPSMPPMGMPPAPAPTPGGGAGGAAAGGPVAASIPEQVLPVIASEGRLTWLGTPLEIYLSQTDTTIREWRSLTRMESTSSPGDRGELNKGNSIPFTRSRLMPRTTFTSAIGTTIESRSSTTTGISRPNSSASAIPGQSALRRARTNIFTVQIRTTRIHGQR